jgi:hypothetical protein
LVFILKDKIAPFHSIKAYRVTRSIVTLILNLDPGWISCLDRFVQLHARVGGPTGGMDVLRKGNFLLLLILIFMDPCIAV